MPGILCLFAPGSGGAAHGAKRRGRTRSGCDVSGRRAVASAVLCPLLMVLLIGTVWLGRAQGAVWSQAARTAEGYMQGDTGNLRLGKWRVLPSLALEGVYDSNIFLSNGESVQPLDPSRRTRDPKVSDYIFHVAPALELAYDMGVRGGIKFGYQADFAFYRRRSDQDWQRQSGSFGFDYRAPGGLLLLIDEQFTDADDPYGNDVQYGLGETRSRWTNDLKGSVGWRFPKDLKLLAHFGHSKSEYEVERDLDAGQNWTLIEAGLGVEKKVMSRTWTFLEFRNGWQEYDDHGLSVTPETDAGNQRARIDTGLKWEGIGRLSGAVSFGYQWLQYDNDRDAQGIPYSDTGTWVGETSVGWKATARTLLGFNFSRNESPSSGAGADTMETTSAGVTLSQELPYKFRGMAGFSYGLSDYQSGRKDHDYYANVGLTYQIRAWLDAGIGYRYLRKDSSDGAESFTGNQFSVMLGARY